MTALLLRLAAPLQSWGTGSRFTRRSTDRVPSKSAVVGLLAAAQGRRRTDPLAELLGLKFAVRTEQAGRVESDFQTASRRGERTPVSVSTRHYLADAVFLAAVEGDHALLDGLQDALQRPHFPLFLGRRSCPPLGRVEQGLRSGTALEVLTVEPWHASERFQKSWPRPTVSLDLVADCPADDPVAELVRDEPVEHGFDPRHRQWEWRTVRRHEPVVLPNPKYDERTSIRTGHEPLEVL